jgi:hypothetical protein
MASHYDNKNTGSQDTDGADRRTDQAALMGAALAAIITITLGPGAWDRFSTVVGITLLSVLAGYYRPVTKLGELRAANATTKALALGAVAGLCTCIAIAQYVQDYRLSDWEEEECKDIANAAAYREANEVAASNRQPAYTSTTADVDLLRRVNYDDTYGNCLGGATTARLPWIWFRVSFAIAAIYLAAYWSRRFPPEPPEATPIGMLPRVPPGAGVPRKIPIGLLPRPPRLDAFQPVAQRDRRSAAGLCWRAGRGVDGDDRPGAGERQAASGVPAVLVLVSWRPWWRARA